MLPPLYLPPVPVREDYTPEHTHTLPVEPQSDTHTVKKVEPWKKYNGWKRVTGGRARPTERERRTGGERFTGVRKEKSEKGSVGEEETREGCVRKVDGA